MVAFNFKERFADDVESGRKRQTIRQKARCKRGDKLQLYTGMMTKQCRKLRDAECTNVVKVEIDGHGIFVGDFAGVQLRDEQADEFSRKDGFKDFADMVAWFHAAYGGLPFHGFLIEWK